MGPSLHSFTTNLDVWEGFVNSTLYQGDIEYIDMPTSTNSYWILPITAINVQGNSISVDSGTDSYAAIDTGTTLVGGPENQIAAIYAQIPNSEPGTGNYEGVRHVYRRDALIRGQHLVDQSRRLPAAGDRGRYSFFALTTGNSAPSWIVGDTFLKNVYSVFRYNPASIGFASLSEYSLSMNGNVDLAVPSATIGSVPAKATAGTSTTSTGRKASNAAKKTSVPLVWRLLLSGVGCRA
ncbi:aspartic peptidase domain-containing protein [Mycena pura]|uniref:Aspartic peptidase domain-containing protein n=1 Tax=Mycena pura TaxID=153505 RepID=A0AAD6YMW5_9AGAR|nr:aspartic peptidase domain-containing protein [Mycena pura]